MILGVLGSIQMGYIVKAKINGARACKGCRASIYKKAQEYHALYSPDSHSKSIFYDGDDLIISLLFEEKSKAMDFQSFLSLWHINNPLSLEFKNVKVERSLVKAYFEEGMTTTVMFSDYNATDSESPLQSLEEYSSHISSCSDQSVVSITEPLFKFQSIEKPEVFCNVKPYKMHIKPQADLNKEPSNMLAGSWKPFYQFFDGLNTNKGLPLVAIKPLTESNFESAMLGEPPMKRSRVDLEVDFLNKEAAVELSTNLKNGSTKLSDTKWKTFVHVLDPQMLVDCLKWRYADTKGLWNVDSDL